MNDVQSESKTLVLLAGGEALRLKSYLHRNDIVKCLSEFGPLCFLDYLLGQAAQAEFKKVIILAGPSRRKVLEHLEQKDLPFEVLLPIEEMPLGTGGCLSLVEESLITDSFWLCNADTYFAENPFLYGSVLLENEAALYQDQHFFFVSQGSSNERGSLDTNASANSNLYDLSSVVYSGVALLKSSVFNEIRRLQAQEGHLALSLEKDIYPALNGQTKLVSWPLAFIDFGTAYGYEKLKEVLGSKDRKFQ